MTIGVFYGSKEVREVLKKQGFKVSEKIFGRIMKKLGLKSRIVQNTTVIDLWILNILQFLEKIYLENMERELPPYWLHLKTSPLEGVPFYENKSLRLKGSILMQSAHLSREE